MNIEHINDVEKDEAQDGGPEGAEGATFVGKVKIITSAKLPSIFSLRRQDIEITFFSVIFSKFVSFKVFLMSLTRF